MSGVGWKSARWLIIDGEMTGLDAESDRIVELGAVWFQSGEVVDRRNMLINPGMPIPAESSEIHGIRNEHVEGKPALADVAEAFCAHVRAADVLVGYNVWFDIGFLDGQCPGFCEAREGIPVIDPIVLVREAGRYWSGKGRHKLTSVCERLGIALEGAAHRASTDCIATARVMERFIDMLPDDAVEAAAKCAALKIEQDERFQEWLAKQPPRE